MRDKMDNFRRGIDNAGVKLYFSMLESKAWKELKPRQKELYILCRLQKYVGDSPADDFPNAHFDRDADEYFYMNWGMVKGSNTYKSYNHGLYKDLKALQDKGFIKCLYSGREKGKKSIFRFSSTWQEGEKYEG